MINNLIGQMMYIKYMKLMWKIQAKDTEFRGETLVLA